MAAECDSMFLKQIKHVILFIIIIVDVFEDFPVFACSPRSKILSSYLGRDMKYHQITWPSFVIQDRKLYSTSFWLPFSWRIFSLQALLKGQHINSINALTTNHGLNEFPWSNLIVLYFYMILIIIMAYSTYNVLSITHKHKSSFGNNVS